MRKQDMKEYQKIINEYHQKVSEPAANYTEIHEQPPAKIKARPRRVVTVVAAAYSSVWLMKNCLRCVVFSR